VVHGAGRLVAGGGVTELTPVRRARRNGADGFGVGMYGRRTDDRKWSKYPEVEMADSSEYNVQDRLSYVRQFIGREFSESPSPFGRWLKGKVVSVETESLVFEYVVRDEMKNMGGQLHGGIIAGICDETIGATAFICGIFSRFVSLNLSVQFLRPAASGVIIARTQLGSVGRRVAAIGCTVETADRVIVANATSQLMNLES
jgi:acyl-coenzyme A thioesterase 13